MYQKKLEEIISLIQKEKTEEAYEKLEKLIKENQNTLNESNYQFNNIIEAELFFKYKNTPDEITLLPLEEPVLEAYYIYGCMQLEKQLTQEAEETFKTAYELNPVYAPTILKLIKISLHKRDFDNYYKYLEEALNYSYQAPYLASAYRYLGNYMMCKEKYGVATAAYLKSLEYEENHNVYVSLELIEDEGFNTEIEKDEVNRILEHAHIQTSSNPFIIKKLNELAKSYDDECHYEGAYCMYKMLYELEGELKHKLLMEEIEAKIAKEKIKYHNLKI